MRPPRTTQARRTALRSGEPGSVSDGLRLSVGTLTAVPVPPPTSLQPPAPGIAMLLAPAVGLIPGIAAWLIASICGFAGLSPLVAAVATVGTLALTTRSLHLDGLADTADGLTASYRRERALEVMRRGDTGPAGMATVVIVLLLQVAALSQVFSRPGWGTRDGLVTAWIAAAVLIAVIAGRVAVPLACTRGIRAARPEGLGATVAGSVIVLALAACVAASALVCSLLAGWMGRPWEAGLGAVLMVLISSGVLLWRAVQRLGGITGDVIGAGVEIGTAAALLVLAAFS